MKIRLFNKYLVIGIFLLLIGASVLPSIGGINNIDDKSIITLYTYNRDGINKCEVELSKDISEEISVMFDELKNKIISDPHSNETQELKNDFVEILDIYELIPNEISKDYVISLLNPKWAEKPRNSPLGPFSHTGSSFLCSIAGEGGGFLLPPVMLPRPRLAAIWASIFEYSFSIAANLYTGDGFAAAGPQFGIALGFMGIGLSFAVPGQTSVFGFGGYALAAFVGAKYVENYPPNRQPVISDENPPNGAWSVPISLSELTFRISDPDNDRMSYWVTTEPDIGSGQGINKKGGEYSIPVSGIENDKLYCWTVTVSDGSETVEKRYGFITKGRPPFDPFEEGWKYRKKIIIEDSQVTGDLLEFPLLFSLIDSNLRDKAQTDGDDILFMDESGIANKLYHEIETYDYSSGELVAWIRIPNLSSQNNTVLYMYYGNSGCSSQQFPEKVWNSNYRSVWHLSDKSGQILDSTFNNNDGSNSGASYGAFGKISKALDFECSDPDKTTFPHSSSLEIDSEVTIELWFKPESFTYDRGTLCTKLSGYYTNILKTGQVSVYTYWNNGGTRGKSSYMDANTPMTIGSWHHIAWSESSNGLRKIFINGVLDAQGKYEASIWSEQSITYMGHNDYNNKDRRVDGILDEVRISNIERSEDWVSTSFNNQNNPLSFYTVGLEESGP
jgi:hypothetical protein